MNWIHTYEYHVVKGVKATIYLLNRKSPSRIHWPIHWNPTVGTKSVLRVPHVMYILRKDRHNVVGNLFTFLLELCTFYCISSVASRSNCAEMNSQWMRTCFIVFLFVAPRRDSRWGSFGLVLRSFLHVSIKSFHPGHCFSSATPKLNLRLHSWELLSVYPSLLFFLSRDAISFTPGWKRSGSPE